MRADLLKHYWISQSYWLVHVLFFVVKSVYIVQSKAVMCNNTTCLPPTSLYTPCSIDGIPRNLSSIVTAATFSICIIIAIMSPLAVAGNAIILTVIWKNPSLRTPSYILLCGLVLTDLFTGLITQPFYVTLYFICLSKSAQDVADAWSSFLWTAVAITITCGNYFSFVAVLKITLMSIERWLHNLVTARRAGLLLVVLMLLPIPLALYRLSETNEGSHGHGPNVAVFLFLLFCLITTSVAYFKVFRIIRARQQQVQPNESTRNCRQPAIDVAKYKKSVYSILYILAVFYISSLPSVVVIVLFLHLDDHAGLYLLFQLTAMLLYLSSSLNPLLYVWRMRDIRAGVKQLLKQLLC